MNRGRRHRKSGRRGERPSETTHGSTPHKEVEQEDVGEVLPYTIRASDVMGRYLVASRDLKPGQLIMAESPLVVGPCQGCQPLCLGCYHVLEDLSYRCPSCSWPLCGADCPGLSTEYGHSAGECALLSSSTVRSHVQGCFDKEALRPFYHAIVPLRCLLLKKHDAAKWTTLNTMEAHNEIRRALPDLWRTNQTIVVDRIRRDWALDFDEDEIHTVCGFLEVNAFEVGGGGNDKASVRALFPRAFYFAHDCVPNTGHTDGAGYLLTVRASTTIKQGEAITLSYAYTLQGTMKRREHLKESKFFDCCCRRCADPTELGTYAGALRCPRCDGPVLSTSPLDQEASWRCVGAKCPGYMVEATSVRLLTDRIGDEVEAIDGNDIEGLEALLEKYRNVLHPNHYHCLGVKHSLSQLYGKLEGYMINELTDNLLMRKRDICRDILKVFNVLEPGYSRLRGSTLYELHAPIMILITRRVASNSISKRDLLSRLKEVEECLQESSVILGYEPANSTEGEMAMAAKDALLRIQEWQRIIGKK